MNSCARNPVDRVVRGIVAIVLWSVALSSGGSLAIAIPAGLIALVFSIGALTGKCPHEFFIRRPEPKSNALGIPEARDALLK